jgi:hypothetical protein
VACSIVSTTSRRYSRSVGCRLVHADLERGVVLAVRDPGPPTLHSGRDDLRILAAHVRIDRCRDGHLQAVEDVDEPPDTDTGAIVAPALVERIRLERGRALEQRDRGLPTLVVLQVERHIEREPGAVRPLDLRAPRER